MLDYLTEAKDAASWGRQSPSLLPRRCCGHWVESLSRFDGYRFTTYKHDPDDPHSMSENHVRDIFEDREGIMTGYDSCVLVLVVLVGILLAACQPVPPPFECTDAIGCVDIAPGEPLKLGVLQALSGGAAPWWC